MTDQNELAWGGHRLAPNQWQELDDLWIAISSRPREFDVSYCYSTTKRGRFLAFSELRELRVPHVSAMGVSQRLSTRPVVARPYKPIVVPSGSQIRLYVGTPLWLTMTHDNDLILDIPVSRISDTWFGADTINGEVCFDCQTKARLSMTDIPVNPFKAITPIEIHNEADTPVTIDRINLPIPHMSLFHGPDRPWTSALTVHCGEKREWSNEVRISIETAPPAECPDGTLVSEPREPLESGILNKTIDLLLG